MLLWMRTSLTICQANLTSKLVEVAGFFATLRMTIMAGRIPC
jgi:hypothetical protein